ncbi:MAG: adenylate/guanylate cyclase domain-containing protein [Gemmatimonadaceae bacterium]
MHYKLTTADGLQSFELRVGALLVVGRSLASDIPILDPSISRRHAEVSCDERGVHVRDLGSSNGTFLNGERVEAASLGPDDTVSFGRVEFRLHPVSAPRAAVGRTTPQPAAAPVASPVPRLGATILRQLPVRPGRPRLAGRRAGSLSAAGIEGAPVQRQKDQQKLEMLLEVSTGLGRAFDTDAILDKIANYAYQLLDVDRVAILLVDDTGHLVPKISRDPAGGTVPRAVPQSIARTVVEEKVALLTDDAAEDARFSGQSIVMQRVRSAICAPLLGSEGRVLGVLYVDNVTTTHRFGEEDLEFLVAFSAIAAVAIENSQYADRIRRETLVRSNFERFFPPALAARIAGAPESVRPGGEKRLVTVLFTDIRGFTALAEGMRPDDMAALLTEYRTEMVDIVFRHGGTLDKFIGDAVMAQWGAPLEGPDDPDRAVRAAIEMVGALDRLNERFLSDGRPEVHVGIGLNYGEAFAGYVGSESRLEFTVIGDTVNTASRLSSAAGPREILISDELRRVLAAPPPLAEYPALELKGKSQPVPVYRVVV